MKKFYCNGKKDFCEVNGFCPNYCIYIDNTGGDYMEVPMTNADRLNDMTIEEKAEFISSIAYGRETPWSEPFARKLCDSCPTVHGTYESGIEDDFYECDFVDGKCPHGSAIVWWLQQPGGEEDKHENYT